VLISRFAQVRGHALLVWLKGNENCISIVASRNPRRRAPKWKPAHKSSEKRAAL
jgi:hypothetical protein